MLYQVTADNFSRFVLHMKNLPLNYHDDIICSCIVHEQKAQTSPLAQVTMSPESVAEEVGASRSLNADKLRSCWGQIAWGCWYHLMTYWIIRRSYPRFTSSL